MNWSRETVFESDQSPAGERLALLRLCIRLTDDPDAAEDVTQETLIIAYGNAAGLRDPARRSAWLAGIARHRCAEWVRRRARDRARHVLANWALDPQDSNPSAFNAAAIPLEWPDLADPAVEVEVIELRRMVRAGLARLRPAARAILFERFVEERSLAEIGARLGLKETAVAMRIQRASQALREILRPQLLADTLSAELAEAAEWRPTGIWCPWCGTQHLRNRSTSEVYQLRCPDCDREPGTFTANTQGRHRKEVLGALRSPKPALARLLESTYQDTRRLTESGPARCAQCGQATTLELALPIEVPAHLRAMPGLTHRCPACGVLSANGIGIIAWTQPETRRFWKENPRMRRLPSQPVVVKSIPALLTRFESVTGASAIDILTERATHRVLGVEGGRT
jgi:RNA polymerase sigma-70 factor (ECF subfamily)